ncbi:hypothetical protein ACHAXR_000831 [Thalassiosira sp. AJA248-18]
MQSMFSGASSFNSDISLWDVSSVEYMPNMFSNAISFDQDLCAWSEDFPYGSAFSIFGGSNCTFQETPQLNGSGPFCASSCDN